MRDAARIPELLDLLRDYWLLHADMRLGQLVLHLAEDRGLFYLSDETLTSELKRRLNDDEALTRMGVVP